MFVDFALHMFQLELLQAQMQMAVEELAWRMEKAFCSGDNFGRSDCMQLFGLPIVFSPSLMQILHVHVMYA